MDVKTAFLNGDLDEEVYINQPRGFIMPGNENKVCKLIKSLYGLKQAPKQWNQKFDEVVLSNGYLLNQADKCVYSKFNEIGKGVIICLYDMLIFGTEQVQVDMTKEFLSSSFSIKDMGEADVILGIRIKHESNRITISQSHYIEKVLKKFNYFDCTPVSTPMDTSEKLMPNNDQVVSQLEYFRVTGCLIYALTCTRPDIAFAVGKLSMYTSNPGTQHWQAIHRVLKYLKKPMDYRLTYTGYPSVLEVRITKVIKGEFEKIKDVKVEDVSLTCDTPLEVFNNEVNRLTRMNDELFTYKVEVANIPCDSKIDDDSEHEADGDMGYDPSDVAFTEWLGSKFVNYKTMGHYTMKALWIYWIR
ncbi:zinc finger, CCHC-type containing protein [Tanacetum coccineum]|uniref:Zinc finger, CCHC-type containing protein n=1 Tax=Tanacetum coccineum TaxID=301880 RepID=A0ABQ4YPD6_9ASTR